MAGELVKIHEGLPGAENDNILVQAEKVFHPDPCIDKEGSIPIYCGSKSDLIDMLVHSYTRTGSAFEGIANKTEEAVQLLMDAIRDWTIEMQLREYVFRYHKAGGNLIALAPDINKVDQRIIVKLVKPKIDFKTKILPGYELCKKYLGTLGTPTCICQSITVRIRDSEWIPRLVSFTGIVQKRVIVAEDIFEKLGGTLNTRRSQIYEDRTDRSFLRKRMTAREDKVMEAAASHENRIAADYSQWRIDAAKRGIYDRDTLGMGAMKKGTKKFSPDRNYGYSVPDNFVPQDWGVIDHIRLLRSHEAEHHLEGFDCDGMRIIDSFRGKSMRLDQIPNVYEIEIKEALEYGLDRVLVKK